tara:strand:+ start:529 stop:774 length:246 start_codon:yes stop_codon:yes gene_type:complete
MKMSKIHVVDTVEVTLDSYDFEEFCKLWNKGEIVDTHRNHYQYKFYTDINKARALLKYYSNTPNSHDYAWNRGWKGEVING